MNYKFFIIVFVSLNYRLGVFGFLYTGTDDAPGNVAFWDKILALKWVRDNIVNFGGDPNRVTIFGESCGSRSVSLFILSRTSRLLFNSAILMSSVTISDWTLINTQSIQFWLNRAKTIGCALETDNRFNSRIINGFININASVLVNITTANITIDGTFLEKSPLELLESGDYKKNISVLIGTCENEGSMSLPNAPTNRNYSQSVQFLSDQSEALSLYATINGTAVAQLYFSIVSPNSTDYDLLSYTSTTAIGDGLRACETMYFEQTFLKYDPKHSNAYQYYYTGKPKMPDEYYYQWFGCYDLYPVFGMPFKFENISSSYDILDSIQAIEIFSHFAKFGYPSPQHGIDWPKYYMLNSHFVTPYFQLNNTHKSVSSFFGYGLKQTECEYLWRKWRYVAVPN